jgi:hypothetical protein
MFGFGFLKIVYLLLVSWWLAPFALLFAKETDRKTTHYGQDPSIQRYVLPKAFWWMETPDELLPGGMYEPTVKTIYDECGWFICSWYWIGIRNVLHGLRWSFGREASKDIDLMSEDQKRNEDFYEVTKKVLFIYVIYGWKTYHDHYKLSAKKSGEWAVPFVTIRFKKE